MTKRKGLWRLLQLWLTSSSLVLVILLVQFAGGAMQAEVKHAWNWFAATMVPSATLLLGSYVAPASGSAPRRAVARIELRVYYVAVTLSLFYMLLVAFPLVAFAVQAERSLTALMDDSMLFLLPVQGLVTLALGTFVGTSDGKK